MSKTGLFNSMDIPAGFLTSIYTCPVGKIITFSVNFSSLISTIAKVRLALVVGGIAQLTTKNYIEYDSRLVGYGVIERTGLVLGEGQTVFVYANLTGISANIYGWEEETS